MGGGRCSAPWCSAIARKKNAAKRCKTLHLAARTGQLSGPSTKLRGWTGPILGAENDTKMILFGADSGAENDRIMTGFRSDSWGRMSLKCRLLDLNRRPSFYHGVYILGPILKGENKTNWSKEVCHVTYFVTDSNKWDRGNRVGAGGDQGRPGGPNFFTDYTQRGLRGDYLYYLY